MVGIYGNTVNKLLFNLIRPLGHQGSIARFCYNTLTFIQNLHIYIYIINKGVKQIMQQLIGQGFNMRQVFSF